MTVFGVGEWGRWAYLWVFLSTPLVASAAMLLFPHSNWGNSKDEEVLILSLPLVFSYLLVRYYYRWSDAQHTHRSLEPSPIPSPPPEGQK